MVAQGLDPGGIVVVGADLGVEQLVVGDVVTVRAAGPGLQVGRGIDMRDAQVAQIGNDGNRVPKGEAGMKLQAIGRFGQTATGVDEVSGFGP